MYVVQTVDCAQLWMESADDSKSGFKANTNRTRLSLHFPIYLKLFHGQVRKQLSELHRHKSALALKKW
jgi:hypothetical protein